MGQKGKAGEKQQEPLKITKVSLCAPLSDEQRES